MVLFTLETFIRHLPHRAYSKMSSMLDPGKLWERMATKIPLKLEQIDDDNPEPRYNIQHIEVFALMGQRAGSGNSPTQRVLIDWGTKNARVHHLIKVLMRAELYQAANYLNNDLLQLGPVLQPQAEDIPAHISSSATHPVSGPHRSDEQKQRSAPPEKDQHAEQNPLMSPVSLSEERTMSDNLSHYSSASNAVLDQGGIWLSQLERQSSVSHEDKEEAWIGLRDIEIQTITYEMLGSVTDNFNNELLEKGGNLIGSGGFGRVYLGRFHNNFKIAVKCLVQTEQIKKEDLIKQFENEVKTLSTYRHENVVHLLGYSIDGPSQCLVYQYLPNGSLEDRLARLQGKPPLSASTRLKIVKGTARGIHYLNENGYVHRDIKSANILLDSEFTAKVGDFATVVMAPSGDSTTMAVASVVIGTPAYLAPEAYSFDISTKLDSYSFGVVLLEVITGLPAHDNHREEKILTSHIMENVEEESDIHSFVDQSAGPWEEGTIEKLYDISKRCLVHRRKRRLNVKDIVPELEKL